MRVARPHHNRRNVRNAADAERFSVVPFSYRAGSGCATDNEKERVHKEVESCCMCDPIMAAGGDDYCLVRFNGRAVIIALIVRGRA